MTDIEQKALALLGEVSPYKCEKVDHAHHAYLCAALRLSVERHEAFRQEVSGVVVEYKADQPYVWKQSASDYFCRFIILKPKPDPLVEIIGEINDGPYVETRAEYADQLRAALDARGFEIREKSDD